MVLLIINELGIFDCARTVQPHPDPPLNGRKVYCALGLPFSGLPEGEEVLWLHCMCVKIMVVLPIKSESGAYSTKLGVNGEVAMENLLTKGRCE